jgi:Flp pilus assembly protein TadB
MTRIVRIYCIALLTVAGLAGSSITVRAEDRDDRHEACERRVRQAEDKLHDAIQRHGEDSRQAHKRREQLEEVRRRCGDDHDRDHHDGDHDHDQH